MTVFVKACWSSKPISSLTPCSLFHLTCHYITETQWFFITELLSHETILSFHTLALTPKENSLCECTISTFCFTKNVCLPAITLSTLTNRFEFFLHIINAWWLGYRISHANLRTWGLICPPLLLSPLTMLPLINCNCILQLNKKTCLFLCLFMCMLLSEYFRKHEIFIAICNPSKKYTLIVWK